VSDSSLLDLPLPGRPEDGEIGGQEPPRQPLRRSRRAFWIALGVVAALAIGYLLPRPGPPIVKAEADVIEPPAQRVSTDGPQWPVELRNDGRRKLRIESLAFEGADAEALRIADDGCTGQAVERAESCVVYLIFAPERAGEHSAALVVTGNAANSPHRLPVLGLGIEPRVAVEPGELTFAPVLLGEAGSPRSVSVKNEGAAPLQFEGATAQGRAAGDFPLAGDGCSRQELAPGESCQITVGFEPRAAGDRRATLALASDAPGSPHQLPLLGRGTAPRPTAVADLDSVDFGDRLADGSTTTQVVEISNAGTGVLEIAAPRWLDDDDAFRLDAASCAGTDLRDGASCELEIAFTPQQEGPRRARLEIASNDSEGPLLLTVEGKGVLPHLVAEPDALDFGAVAVGASAARSLKILNDGSAPFEVGSLGYRDAAPAGLQVVADGCSRVLLAPGEACRLELAFEPPDESVLAATLLAPPRAAGPGGLEVALRGRGARGRLELSSDTLELGAVAVGASARRALDLRNAGEAPLAIQALRLEGSRDLRVAVDGCRGASLAPGAECKLVVELAPSAPERLIGTLAIRHDGRDGSTTLQASGSGVLPSESPLAIEPTEVSFSSPAVGTRSDIRTLRLHNRGAGRLRLGRIEIEGPQADDFTLVPATCSGVSHLAPDSSCTVGVRFTASAAGPRSARLLVEHGGTERPQELALDGEAPDTAGDAPPLD
jgi:hypothetical protein